MTGESDPQVRPEDVRSLGSVLSRVAELGQSEELVSNLTAENRSNAIASGLVGAIGDKTLSGGLSTEHRLVLVESPPANANTVLDVPEVVERFERDGVVKKAPYFRDQVNDTSRTASFKYLTPFGASSSGRRGNRAAPEVAGEATEHEGLQELKSTLTGFLGRKQGVQDGPSIPSKTGEMVARASSMIENLTFIGDPEYREGVKGLGEIWKSYLDEDPSRQICLLTELNSVERYKGTRKSDEFLKDSVLQTFSDDELEKYSGRIVEKLTDITTEPEHARVIMVDDWTVSGQSLRESYALLRGDPLFQKYAQAGRVEVNLLVASEERIKKGLPLRSSDGSGDAITVRSYYQSHNAHGTQDYVTGLHSATNYDFAQPLKEIARKLPRMRKIPPMLARIAPQYRDEANVVIIEADRLSRRDVDVREVA